MNLENRRHCFACLFSFARHGKTGGWLWNFMFKIIFIIKLSARILLLLHMKAYCLHLGYRNIPQFLQSNESKTEAVSLGPPLWTRLTHNLGSLPTLKHRFKILDTNLTRTKILSKTISSEVFCMLLLHVDWTIVMHSILELVNHFLLV